MFAVPCVGRILESELPCQANCLSDGSSRNKLLLRVSGGHRDVALEGPAPQQPPEFGLIVQTEYGVGVKGPGAVSY